MIGGADAAEHVVDEVLDEQPFVRACEDVRLVFLHPEQAEGGVEDPYLVTADGELSLRSDVLHPPAMLRFGARAMPTDKGVEPVAVGIDGEAIHAHTGYGDAFDIGRIVQLRGGLTKGVAHAAPDLFGLPNGPVGMLRVGVESLGWAGGMRDGIAREVVDDGLQGR